MLPPEDLPHELGHLYLVPQSCDHTLEVRSKEAMSQKELAPLLGERCPWCQAEDNHYDEMPAEIRTPYKGGLLVRQSVFDLPTLKELHLLELEVMKDAGPQT